MSHVQWRTSMIAVIFEVWPATGRTQDYLDLAASLRSELEATDGFISVERFRSRHRPGQAALAVDLARRGSGARLAKPAGASRHAGQRPGRGLPRLSSACRGRAAGLWPGRTSRGSRRQQAGSRPRHLLKDFPAKWIPLRRKVMRPLCAPRARVDAPDGGGGGRADCHGNTALQTKFITGSETYLVEAN